MPRTLTENDVSEFRQRLCDAAARLFIERGPEAVTMRSLAKELGCSAMTPYRYFKDKDAILAAVRARGFDEFASALAEANAEPGDATAKTRAFGQAYLRFAREKPHVYRMMFDKPFQGEGLAAELARAGDRARDQMFDLVKRLAAAGIVQGDAALIANTLWSGAHGAAMLSLGGILSVPAEAERICLEILHSIIEHYRPVRRSPSC